MSAVREIYSIHDPPGYIKRLSLDRHSHKGTAIVTSSPVSYLSAEAMEALAGKPGCTMMNVMIHSDNVNVSPHDKHFSNVNGLGMDFLSDTMLSLSMDYDRQSFQLTLLHTKRLSMHFDHRYVFREFCWRNDASHQTLFDSQMTSTAE